MDLLDKLYKLMESFFSNFGIIPISLNLKENNDVGFMQARWRRHLSWTSRFLVSNFESIF